MPDELSEEETQFMQSMRTVKRLAYSFSEWRRHFPLKSVPRTHVSQREYFQNIKNAGEILLQELRSEPYNQIFQDEIGYVDSSLKEVEKKLPKPLRNPL